MARYRQGPSPVGRVATKRRRPAPPPRRRPWPVVILAVDPGRRSGWAIWVEGLLRESGEVDALEPVQVDEVVRRALLLESGWRRPAVLVLEQPWSGRRGYAAGPSRPIWRAAWKRGGGVQRRVVGLYPASWRSRMLGRGMGSAARADVRPAEQQLAAQLAGREVGPDEAAAIVMGACACRAGEVGAVLPKRTMEAKR